MLFKRNIKKTGFFEMNQLGDTWMFHPEDGSQLRVVNRELVPKDTVSDYQVTGILNKNDSERLKIVKVSRVTDQEQPEFDFMF